MRINKISGIFVLVAMFVIGLTSCGGYSEKAGEKMIEKYEDGEITKDEMATCIDWVEDAQNEELEMLQEALDKSKNLDEYIGKMNECREIIEYKWKGLGDVVEMLSKAGGYDKKTMGHSNRKRWRELQDKYQARLEMINSEAQNKFND